RRCQPQYPYGQHVTPYFRPIFDGGRIAGSDLPGGVRDARRGQRRPGVWYDAGFRMLRAALIGFVSSGKTTLFQLMTSARETARAAHGKGETAIGISKVPDERLDRLTAMYNPRKRVPATVEFTDLVAPGGASGAKALVDVAAYKNAD